MSEKTGYNSAANIFIDKAQRLALQKDIDKESLPTVSVRSLKVRADIDDKKMVAVKKNVVVNKEEHTENTKKKKIKAETMLENQIDSNVYGENTVDENKRGTKNKPSGSLTDTRGLNAVDTPDCDGRSIQKKKKKGNLVKVEEGTELSQEVEDKGGPKKRKHCYKAEEMEISIMEPGEKVDTKTGGKKTKVEKKEVKINEKNISETMEDIQEEDLGETPKKRRKLTPKNGEAEKEVVVKNKKIKKVAPENGEAVTEVVVIPKKKKKVAPENGEAVTEVVVKKKKIKKVAPENGEAVTGVVVIPKKKKKVAPENGEEEEVLWKKEMSVAKATVTVKAKKIEEKDDKKKRLKSNFTDSEMGGEEEAKVRGRKKAGKKETRKVSAPTEDVIEVEEGKPKLKKKVHSKVEERAKDAEGGGTIPLANRKKAEKGSKAGSLEVKAEMQEIPVREKRKKIKVEQCYPEDQVTKPQRDVVFLSETKGNADEINIDQARRLALQKEIDVESNPVQPKVASGLGQWGTAQFDSSDQQNKFLRLMGGFKKGGQPMGAGGTTSGRANMALTKDGQQGLQQKLMGEFERAQSRRMDFAGRGAGLGFSAPSNKKFSIDINATRSVRFDD